MTFFEKVKEDLKYSKKKESFRAEIRRAYSNMLDASNDDEAKFWTKKLRSSISEFEKVQKEHFSKVAN